MIKLQFILLLFTFLVMEVNAQTSVEDKLKEAGFFETMEELGNGDHDNYYRTFREVVRMPKGEDKVNAFFDRLPVDTSGCQKYNELNQLYNYSVALLEYNNRFQSINRLEKEKLEMMKHLVAHNYDSIYGFSVYYFDEVRQLPSDVQIYLCDKDIEKYKKSIALYQTDKEGLIDIALSCLKHGARFPVLDGVNEYSNINLTEHGWFGGNETILSFYKNIYKKYNVDDDQKWELLSPSVILLKNIDNPYLSETTFTSLINMMSDDEKNTFIESIDPDSANRETSYNFFQMLFDFFPTASTTLGFNKLHLAIAAFDMIRIRDIVANEKSMLQETSVFDDKNSIAYTPLQFAEYKLTEFEKDLALEQQKMYKTKYNDEELFYTFRVEQIKKIISILKQNN